ncbi:Rhodanese-related sulfurtransferase [Candidatus Methanophagaceae archaeon]|nr:Rhodanese-related sulfurtransferase [Methanophagales archaeon]
MKKIIAWIFVMLLLLVSSSAVAYAELTPPLPGAPTYDVSADKAHKMLVEKPEQFILLDVRTEREYNAEKIDIEGVELMNIPVSDLESRIDELDNSKVIIAYCKSGIRSNTAKNTLAQHDFIAYNMLGGINAWKAKYDTSMSTGVETTLPTISPVHTPVATVTPVISPKHTPTVSPTASPVTTPAQGAGKEVPGFEVIAALAAISLIVWRRRVLRKL